MFKRQKVLRLNASKHPTGRFFVMDLNKNTILDSFNDKPAAEKYAKGLVETIDDRFAVLQLAGETRFEIKV